MKNTFYSRLVNIVFILAVTLVFSQDIQGTYAIENVETGKVLRIKDANRREGTPLVSYSPVNWKCVTWDFKHVEDDYYQLRNLFTDKTFQSSESYAKAGNALEQKELKTNLLGQQYEFISVDDNVYLIKLRDTDLYVTPSDKTGATNSSIVLAKKMNNRLQYWKIYKQNPTM